MLDKFQIHIETARTIDTPYLRKNINANTEDINKINDYQNHQKVLKRKNFLINQNSLTLEKKNRLQISNQFNHSNTLNISKSKSFAKQQQHSKNFITSFDRSKKQKHLQDQSQKNIKQIRDAKSVEMKRSLSKKTQKIKFPKINAYLQEVKSRRILQSVNSGIQFSMADLTQRISNKDEQPELNIEVCERYCAINTSVSLINLNRYHKVDELSEENVKEQTKTIQLFPKSRKYKQSERIKNQQPTLNNEYYSNKLPINTKTLLMSKKYNFKLKDSSYGIEKNINNKILSRRQNNQKNPPYSLVQSFYRSNQKHNRQDILSRSTSFKKTESLQAHLNRSAFDTRKTFVKNQNMNRRTFNKEDLTLVQDIPQNILIQQEDFKQQKFHEKSLNFQEYGFQTSVKSYSIKKTTKTFICKYCLQIFNIFQITGHKGKVCIIAYKETQFVQKIKKLSKFLNQTYDIYYQRRSLYDCYYDLAKKLEIKLQVLTNEQKFQALALKLRSIFRLKQNYYRPQSLILKDKDRIFIEKIQQYLHLDDFIKLQEVFEAVDRIISLGKQGQNDNYKGKVPIYRPKVVLTKDLFWLVRKLFQGLVLIKIKQISI